MDLALIVVEPTLSGRHDFRRVVRLTRQLNVSSHLVVNKADLNLSVTAEIEREAAQLGVSLAGRIPFDPEVTRGSGPTPSGGGVFPGTGGADHWPPVAATKPFAQRRVCRPARYQPARHQPGRPAGADVDGATNTGVRARWGAGECGQGNEDKDAPQRGQGLRQQDVWHKACVSLQILLFHMFLSSLGELNVNQRGIRAMSQHELSAAVGDRVKRPRTMDRFFRVTGTPGSPVLW